MRTLSATLTTAQKSLSSSPYIQVTIEEKIASAARLTWSQLYTGSEPLYYHAAAIPGDGSLVRARIHNTTYQLYRQRVPNPAPGSDFSLWTAVAFAAAATSPALAASGVKVALFWVSTDPTEIYWQESTDSGVSWSTPSLLYKAASAVSHLAAAYATNGDLTLFFSLSGVLYSRIRPSGQAWGTPQAWTLSLSSITGVAAHFTNQYCLAVTGADTATKKGVWTTLFTGSTWAALQEVALAESDSAVSYQAPSLTKPDVFRLYFVEKFSGSDPYTSSFFSFMLPGVAFPSDLWREPVPWSLASHYGVALTFTASYAFLSNAQAVWRAPLSPAVLDVSGDVLSLEIDTTPRRGRAVVELRNDNGQYNSFAKLGCQLSIALGYRTTAGAEVSSGLAYWIDAIEHTRAPGEANLVVYAGDPWDLWGGFVARRQFRWASGEKSVSQLLQFLLAKAGLEMEVVSQSTLFQSYKPAFTLHPGDSGAVGAERLLAKVPDVLFFRGAKALIKNPQAGDAAQYVYGGTGEHPILQGVYRQQPQPTNYVKVFRQGGGMTYAATWSEVDKVYDRIQQVSDISLTSPQDKDRAEALLREAAMEGAEGSIIAPLNCGQELYDVVGITESALGLATVKRRVWGLRHTFASRQSQYILQITLEAP